MIKCSRWIRIGVHHQQNTQQILDAVLVEDLVAFRVKSTWLAGELAAQADQSLLPVITEAPINQFKATRPDIDSLQIKVDAEQVKTGKVRVIDVFEGKLVTREKRLDIEQFPQSPISDNNSHVILNVNPEKDIFN